MKVCTAIPVRYAETDKMAVVYHANYLLYFEDARTRFLEELGYPYARIEQAGYMSPVSRSKCTTESLCDTVTLPSYVLGSVNPVAPKPRIHMRCLGRVMTWK